MLKERENVPSELQHEGRVKEMEIVMKCESDKNIRIQFGITILCNCYLQGRYSSGYRHVISIQHFKY